MPHYETSSWRLFTRRRLTSEELREDEEARLRGAAEWRQAEQRKSENQRGIEGSSQMPPLGRP